ncbi:MAG: hypothetical protein PHF97_12665, partial [Bacteroidales bacterium]|nr:hypothetical protein [Bacteroidales bacterium]
MNFFLPYISKRLSKFTLILLLFSIPLETVWSQSRTCHDAGPFCGDQSYTFPAGVCPPSQTCNAEQGPAYGCLGSTPNPAWYFMQIGNPGTIIITISNSANVDIDFICWGPLTSPTGGCTSGLTSDKIVSCSYSNAATETCTIDNALSGQFYMLLITNFSNAETNITFYQSNYGQPGAGTTNCNIVIECSILSLTPVPTVCNPATNTYNVNGTIEFTNPPTTGVLTIKDITATPPVIANILPNPVFTSPLSYTLTGIPCDGLQHTLLANFSESINPCSFTTTYQAPVSVCPVGTISGGGIICDNGQQTTVNVNITGAPPPYTFTYAINGIPHDPPIITSGPFPYQIITSTPGIYTLTNVSNSSCSGPVSGSATVTLVPLPTPPTPASAPFYHCDPGTVTLNANDIPGSQINWYDIATGGTKLFTGNSFSTPSLTSTTTYYAESETTSGNCVSSSRTPFTAEIVPIPIADIVDDQVLCHNATTSAVAFSGNVPGTVFNWTNSDPTIGLAASGTGDIAAFIATNTGTIPVTATIVVTPTFTSLSGATCIGTPITFTITVSPIPTVNSVGNQVLRHNATTSAVAFSGDAPGTVFNWTNSDPTIGLAASGTGDIAAFTATNTGTIPVTATIVVTPTFTNTAVTCTGTSTSFTITVNPIPTVNSVGNQVLCHNATTSAVAFSGDAPG